MATKYYTFMNLNEAIGKNGNYTAITVGGNLTKFEMRQTPNGKAILTASMPIEGRSKILNSKLATTYGDDETVWAKIQIWEDRAERFQKMLTAMNDPKTVRLVICGQLVKNSYTNKNTGKLVTVPVINVNDWGFVTLPGQQTQNNVQQTSSAAVPASASTINDEAKSGFDENGFVIMEENDTLPF